MRRIELPFSCPDCGASVVFSFDFGGVGACGCVARVFCEACGRVFAEEEGAWF